jgi:hypothetical protein
MMLILGTAAFGNALVFTPETVIVTCTHIITRRRSLFIDHASGVVVVWRSGDRKDHVDGYVLQ